MAKPWIKGIILAVLIAVGGWATFRFIIELIKIPFEKMGVVNPIWQYLSLMVVIVIILKIGWHTGLKSAVKKLVR